MPTRAAKKTVAKKTAARRPYKKRAAKKTAPSIQMEPQPVVQTHGEQVLSDPLVDITFPLSVTGKQLIEVGTTIPELQRSIHLWAINKGWRGEGSPDRHFSDEVALIASEVFEALEAWRNLDSITDVWPGYTVEVEGVKFKDLNREQLGVILGAEDDDELDIMIEELKLEPKMMGVAPELADTVVRIFETCEEYGIDLLTWVKTVMDQNHKRDFRHGGKPM